MKSPDETTSLLIEIPSSQAHERNSSLASSTTTSSYDLAHDIETGGGGINSNLPPSVCMHETIMTTSNHGHGHNSGLEALRSKTFALEHQHHHVDEHVAEHMHGSLLASVILLFALSIHSIFEGIAIGISSSKAEVWSTTTAVLAHKAFAGYALGSSMVASQMNERHFFILVTVFACCSVMGIFLGMLFETISTFSNNNTATGVIQAMVAGTFLYVSIVEIGLKELLLYRDSKMLGDHVSRRDMEWSKLASFLLGYLLMSALAEFV
jgi:zinc transporter ZupT